MQFVSGLAIKPAQRAPMLLTERIGVSVHGGIEGNWVRQTDKDWEGRMITLTSYNQWQKIESDLGRKVPWVVRRSNIQIMNVWFTKNHIGQQLKFEGGVVLEITGETTPCKLMEKFDPRLREIMAPEFRGGVTCRVIEGGTISLEDRITWPD